MTQYYRGYEVISNKNSGTKSTEFSGIYRGIRHVGVANDDKSKATKNAGVSYYRGYQVSR